jgi:hypothetical protein
LTLTTLLPVPNAPTVLMSYVFSEMGDGSTHIEIRVAKARRKDAVFLEHVVGEFRNNISNEIATLRELLERNQLEAGIDKSEPAASRKHSSALPADEG